MRFKMKSFSAALTIALLASFNAYAGMNGSIEVEIKNTKVTNSGTIRAKSKTTSGVSTTSAGQIVVAPHSTRSTEVEIKNVTVRNSGTIEAESKTYGGVTKTTAGQILIQ